MQPAKPLRKSCRGHAVVEMTLLSPWILFLFIGIFDMGFYAHALIATQNAARAAAIYTSKSSLTAAQAKTAACNYALAELKAMANVRSLSNCDSKPLIVTADSVLGVDGSQASLVSVTYTTDKLIPMPGLTGQLTITRKVQMMSK